MTIRGMALSEVERLAPEEAEAVGRFHMDEDAFRAFYDRTARALWAYLARVSGDATLADDLMQEAYYRFLRAPKPMETEAHRRNYLFRIATNLLHDRRRRPSRETSLADEEALGATDDTNAASRSAARTDVQRALARLTLRERQILWLAYAEGSSHREIAGAVGVRAASVRVLLFRARRKLAGLLSGSR